MCRSDSYVVNQMKWFAPKIRGHSKNKVGDLWYHKYCVILVPKTDLSLLVQMFSVLSIKCNLSLLLISRKKYCADFITTYQMHLGKRYYKEIVGYHICLETIYDTKINPLHMGGTKSTPRHVCPIY